MLWRNVQDPDEKQIPWGDVDLRHYPDEKIRKYENEDIPGCGSCMAYCMVCPEGSRKYRGTLKKYVVQIVHSHTLIEWGIYFNFIHNTCVHTVINNIQENNKI